MMAALRSRPLLALVSTLLALAAVEGVLALADVAPAPPDPASRLEIARGPDGSVQLRAFGRYRTAIRTDKPEGVVRTVLVGDSTVYGYHVRPHGTLNRFLDVLLPAAAGGEAPHQVVALAAPALASGQLLALVELAIAHMEPDLVVVYSGNNELRPRVAAAARARGAGSWWGRALARLRLYRWLRGDDAGGDGGGDAGAASRGDDALAEALRVDWLAARADGPAFGEGLVLRAESRLAPVRAALLDDYERHLEAMIDACAVAGVPLALCVPVGNGREFGPIAPACSVPLGPAERRRLALDVLAATRRLDAGALDEAEAALDAVEAVDPRLPPLLAARARLARARGETARARRYDRLALQLDDAPRVAPHDVVERLRIVAARRGVPLVDARAVFERAPDPAEPRLFADHCHPSIYGQYRLAAEIARTVVAHGLLAVAEDAREVLPAYAEACRALDVPGALRRPGEALRAAGDLVYALEAYDGARYRDRARAALEAVEPWGRAPTTVVSADLVLALLEDDGARARARVRQLERRGRDELEKVFRSLRLRPLLEAAGLRARLPAMVPDGGDG